MTQLSTQDLYTRDGHLTMLTLDRFDAGELPIDACDDVMRHIHSCDACADRLSVVVGGLPLTPPQGHRGEPHPQHDQRDRGVFWSSAALGSGLAAAAAVLLAVWPSPEQASPAPPNSAPLHASAYTSAAGDEMSAYSEPVRVELSNERLSWDEPLVVTVSSLDQGFAAVVLHTPRHDDIADGTGGEQTFDGRLGAPATPVLGDQPKRFVVEPQDDAVGEQHIAVVWCPERFVVDLQLEANPSECVVEQFTVTRTRTAAASS